MKNTPPSTESSPSAQADADTAHSRHDSWTPERQRAFCEALAETGNVERAAQSVGMAREGAYRLRRRAHARAFALAWDAALLLARQRLIDDVMNMAFEGSVERHYREGKLIVEKRRRDPRALLATIERLGSNKALGSAPATAVAQDFEQFLDCMETDARHQRGAAAQFMELRADAASILTRESLVTTRLQLIRAMHCDLPAPES